MGAESVVVSNQSLGFRSLKGATRGISATSPESRGLTDTQVIVGRN